MRRLTLIFTLFLISVMFSLDGGPRAQETAQPAAKRHRIAVVDFDYATVTTAPQEVFGTPTDVGKGISEMLISRLVSDGTYQVIGRSQIEKVLKAQNLSDGRLGDPETAAKIGHILGVDAVVLGEVMQFGWDGPGGETEATPAGSAGHDGAANTSTRKAEVAITAQIVDTNTGQTLARANSKGVSNRSGTRLLEGAGTTSGSVAMDSSSFAQSMIGEATIAAVSQMAKELEGENAILPTWARPPLRGQITDASQPDIVINVGSAAGLKVGDKMLVTREVHVVRERVNNTQVGSVEDEVGVLTITSVQEDSAAGRFSGAMAPKTGDLVRPLQ